MTLQKQQLLELLIFFDPLSINSDVVYESVTDHIGKKDIENEASFKQEASNALDIFFGDAWHSHTKEGFDEKISLIYSRLTHVDEKLDSVGDSVWFDGTKIFKVVSWPTQDIIHGRNIYINDAHDQEIFLETSEVSLGKMVHISEDLALYFDENGRILAPGHGLDNLYLDNFPDTPTTLPKYIQGQAYIKTPNTELLEERDYINTESLGDMQYDRTSQVIYFGGVIGELNVEVSSDFIISISNEKIVNAWIKISA